jgi:hypothetical protein
VSADTRRAPARWARIDGEGTAAESGDAEAVITDEGLEVGPVTVSFLDCDSLVAGDHGLSLHLWPEGRLVLSGLGRRFDTFLAELRRARNQARVKGLLAHGVTMPEVYPGAWVNGDGRGASVLVELQVYDTHFTVVPQEHEIPPFTAEMAASAGEFPGDPWQIPFGAMSDVRARFDPPHLEIDTPRGVRIFGRLGRQRDACHAAIVERRDAQRRTLDRLTGQVGFSDGSGISRSSIQGFDQLLDRFTAPERRENAREIIAAMESRSVGELERRRAPGPDEPCLGFVQLLDPDAEGLKSPDALPDNWAAFLLVPCGKLTVLEILAGPSAATYVFQGMRRTINDALQQLHFRRAPLALTEAEAALTHDNPHRLALRRLPALGHLRSATVARIVHGDGWERAFREVLTLAGDGS